MSLVLHITNRPTPYRLPLFRELARQLSPCGDRLHVVFLGNATAVRRWVIPDSEFEGFEYTFPETGERLGAKQVEVLIDTMQPDTVVLAWAMDTTALAILLHCRRRRISCVVLCGESQWSFAAMNRRWLRRLARQPFFRLANGFVSYGQSSTEYLLSEGVARERVATGINVVDTGYFSSEVDRIRGERDKRGDYNDNVCRLLFVGYLLRPKGVSETLYALSTLRNTRFHLDIVGDGEELGSIEQLIDELGLRERVTLHGYLQRAELPELYARADILLFPSLWEVFGLVMVEAAAASLPIIASRFAGGTMDVVDDGVNGSVVDPRNTLAYAAAIEHLVTNPDRRRAMGDASRRKAESSLTIPLSAQSYIAGIKRFS